MEREPKAYAHPCLLRLTPRVRDLDAPHLPERLPPCLPGYAWLLENRSVPSITVSDSYSSSNYAAYTSFTAKTTVTVGSKTAYAYFTDSDSASSWSYTDTEGTVFIIGDTATGTYTALPAE